MPIHDSSAIAYLVNNNLFKTIQYPVVVETEGISRGKTWMGTSKTEDLNNPWAERINVNICMEVVVGDEIFHNISSVCSNSNTITPYSCLIS